jgi:predicted MFS family arabinose efflux permease
MSHIPVMGAGSRGSGQDAAPRRGLGATAVLALGTFAVGTDAFVLAGFLPATAASLGVSTAAAGQAVTVFAAGYAMLSPVLATVTARLPRRKLLAGALLVLAVANLGSALSPDLPMLLTARVLAAAGASAFTPNAGAVSSAMVRPELRARALAIYLGIGVGTLLGGVILPHGVAFACGTAAAVAGCALALVRLTGRTG